MSELWIALIVCALFVLSGLLPLIRSRGRNDPPLPKKETLRDWRKGD